MRYAYGVTAAILLGGSAVALISPPAGAQVAQNEPGRLSTAQAPRPGAPLSFADLVAQLQPAVVNISTDQTVEVPDNPLMELFQGRRPGTQPRTQRGQSLGSGFIISADGYVVTNNHVVSPGRQNAVVNSITVTLPDRREFKAKLVGRDASSDLAVLKIDAGETLPFVRFGDSESIRVGDWVLAIGEPFGLGGTVTAGIVSALGRVTGQGGAYDRFIQTDAAINQGNSGGPMFDLQGNVVGINSQIFSPSGGNVGIGFAIPAEQAQPVIQQLIRGQSIERGYLGVGIQGIDDELAESLGLDKNQGELITNVEPSGPAATAGIQRGDVVVAVNGRAVTPDDTLSFLVANLRPGTRVPIELLRDGRRQRVTVTLAQRPTDEEFAQRFESDDELGTPGRGEGTSDAASSLGLALQPLTPAIARRLGVDAGVRGLVVAGVDPRSDAAQIGLQRGDVVLSANRRSVTTTAEIEEVVSAARAANRQSVALLVQRGGNPPRYVSVPIQG